MSDFKIPDTQWLKGFRSATKISNKRITKLESLNQAEMDSNHRLIARNLELEAQLEVVRGLVEALKETTKYSGWLDAFDEILAAIGEVEK